MKLIFLDFDGVLVNRRSWFDRSGRHAVADPPCVEALNYIVAKTGAQIVVSSSWRLGTPLPELRGLLKSWGVLGNVIDKTPFDDFGRTRGAEISEWMASYTRHEIESFVILDDDADMDKFMPRLIRTEFNLGLTMEHAEKAVAMLESSS